MRELRIDAEKAERIIAQTLRDQFGLLPGKANEAAAEIRKRLDASMSTPTNPAFAHYRLISRHGAPAGMDQSLWKRVYEAAEELPPGIAEGLK